ncbi:MAG: chorismate mutase [Lentisphaeria bacterium]|nr:chorismate mutase [Lentisphaeria bacterium]
MPDDPHNPAQLDTLRGGIDAADADLLPAFVRRMEAAVRIADCKCAADIPVSRPGREHVILDRIRASVPPEFADDAERLYRTILAISCSRQRIRILNVKLGRRIVLCGIKHCGKTRLGQALAKTLALPFFDTDALLEADAGKPVRALYKEVGEARFRELEAATIRKFIASAPSPAVVALGGGVVSNPVLTPDDLHALGIIVWLDVPVPTAFERMAREGLPPFLADKPDPSVEFNRICAARRPVFRAAADAVLELPQVLPVEEAIDRLLIVLESKVISQ